MTKEIERGICSPQNFAITHGGELLHFQIFFWFLWFAFGIFFFLAACNAFFMWTYITCRFITLCLQYMANSNTGFRLACRYTAWSSLAVSELQLSAATPLWLYHRAASLQSWIEFNCLRSAAVGKAARLLIFWLDAACRLVIALQQVGLAQLYKTHHQSGNAASGKLVWKQHNLHFFALKQSRGTITHPPYKTEKMGAAAVVFTQWSKRDQILLSKPPWTWKSTHESQISIDIECNKRLDCQRPCLEDDLTAGSNNIVQSNKSVWRRW